MLSNAETRRLYDRFGRAGLRRGGYTPSFDLGNLSDLFATFFGDDLFGGAAGPRAARGADVGVAVELDLVDAATGVTRGIEVELATTCDTCGGPIAPARLRFSPESVLCIDCARAARG